jgi:hypothetical protein
MAEETSSLPQKRYAMVRTQEWKFLLSESRPPELYQMNGGWVETRSVADRPEFAAARREWERCLRSFGSW